jgi:hypothetical protein
MARYMHQGLCFPCLQKMHLNVHLLGWGAGHVRFAALRTDTVTIGQRPYLSLISVDPYPSQQASMVSKSGKLFELNHSLSGPKGLRHQPSQGSIPAAGKSNYQFHSNPLQSIPIIVSLPLTNGLQYCSLQAVATSTVQHACQSFAHTINTGLVYLDYACLKFSHTYISQQGYGTTRISMRNAVSRSLWQEYRPLI